MWIAQVPDKTIGPCRFRDMWFLLFLLLAGEGPDNLARGVKEGQGDLALRLLLQVVMDNRAIGRILPGVEILLHLFAGGYFPLAVGHLEWTKKGEILARSRWHTVAGRGQETECRARLKEMHAGFAHLIA